MTPIIYKQFVAPLVTATISLFNLETVPTVSTSLKKSKTYLLIFFLNCILKVMFCYAYAFC